MQRPTALPSRLLPSGLARGISAALLGVALAASQPAIAWAEALGQHSQLHTFQVAAGPLSSTLAEFASQAGITLPLEPDLVQGLKSPGFSGKASVPQALGQLLQGTGLQASDQGNGLYLLNRASSSSLELGATTVTGTGLGLTTEGSGSYTTGASAAATRLPLTLRETPQSVSVITRQQMDDQGLQSISDVLQQAPGITVNRESSEAYSFYSRGFQIENFQFDGIPSLSTDGGSLRDNYSIGNSLIYDRVEILKGATGLVNGAGYPSGIVNLVRKRPTAQFQGHVAAGAGSWDKYNGEVDLSGPLVEGGAIRGRMVAGSQTQKSYVDYLEGDQHVFYGVLEADLAEDTTLTLGYDVQKNQNNGSTTGALPAFYQDGSTISFDRSTNAADRWAYRNQDTQRAFAELSHEFANEWTFKAQASGRDYRSRELISGITSEAVQMDNSISHGFYPGGASRFNTTTEEQSLDLFAKGPFSVGGRVHEAVFGYSIASTQASSKRYDGDTEALIDDVFNWNNNATKPARFDWWSTFDFEARQRIAFAATVLKPTDRLSLILGARVVDYRWEIDRVNALRDVQDPSATVISGEVVPYAGLTFDLDDHHTAYASYTDVFKPQSYIFQANGSQIDPLTGESYEVGIKGSYLNDRVNASVALFELQQDNFAEATGATTPDGGTAYRAVQGVTTRGIELEVSGEVLERLQLQAGYTFQESHDADHERVASTQPQHLFKLATNYRLPGDWQRLTVGGNLHWQSRTYFEAGEWYTLSNPSKFQQKSYSLVGLVAGYDFSDQLKGSLNLNNLFDKHYYSGIGNYETVYYGAPRNLMATLKYSF